MEPIRFTGPSLWAGKRWLPSTFNDPKWRWETPSKRNHLHVMVPNRTHRIHMTTVESHTQIPGMPAGSVLWLDEYSSIVCPELLLLQMARSFSMPALVLLGYELCGHFSRNALNPKDGPIQLELPSATSVETISSYISTLKHIPGVGRVRSALRYIADHAISPPEALLATMYSLPSKESGYGLGPVTLNSYVKTLSHADAKAKKGRYPDILFSFAPIGINYDGENHLDLGGLIDAARKAALANVDDRQRLETELSTKKAEVRNKVIDDLRRNRQLAASGKIVFPVTKEDLSEVHGLDDLTRQILACAHSIYGVNTSRFKSTLENTEQARDRRELLTSLLPSRATQDYSHGSL